MTPETLRLLLDLYQNDEGLLVKGHSGVGLVANGPEHIFLAPHADRSDQSAWRRVLREDYVFLFHGRLVNFYAESGPEREGVLVRTEKLVAFIDVLLGHDPDRMVESTSWRYER